MNNDQRINSLIKEFTNHLQEYIPEFQEVWEAKRAVESDSASKKLWKDKEEIRQTIELLKKQGLPVSLEQEQLLALKLKEMRGNPITMRYLKAINFAGKISGKIGADLMDFVGVDFAAKRGCK